MPECSFEIKEYSGKTLKRPVTGGLQAGTDAA
jgi:hypothetical protein